MAAFARARTHTHTRALSHDPFDCSTVCLAEFGHPFDSHGNGKPKCCWDLPMNRSSQRFVPLFLFFSACCHSHSVAHGHSFFRRWFSPFSQSLDVESISFQFLTMRTFTEQSIWCVKVCWWCYDHSEGFWANFRVSACVLIYSTCADTDFVASERFIRNVTERMSCVHIIGALSSSLFTLERVFPLTCLHLQVSFPCELYFGQ